MLLLSNTNTASTGDGIYMSFIYIIIIKVVVIYSQNVDPWLINAVMDTDTNRYYIFKENVA